MKSVCEHEILVSALCIRDGNTAENIERAHPVHVTRLVFRALGQPLPMSASEMNVLK